MDENLPAGQVVGTVKATDLDPSLPNNKLTYAIIPDDGTFSIDPTNGLITTKVPLDREKKDLHELIAHVFDHGVERSRWVLGYSFRVRFIINERKPMFRTYGIRRVKIGDSPACRQ